ncbi:MAG: WYL domain-containing protein [Oscillospiraceae bacterium]|nr:WYL domain-containing protein [Oscillospiraceae bacterium]
MAGNKNAKLKLLYLLRYLETDTDEDHGVTVDDIIDYLNNNEIDAERKSVYTDIELLKKFGLDIITTREGHKYSYKLISRNFELAELKLLADAVGSSKFITRKKSLQLVDKLSKETSRFQASQLKRQVYVEKRVKTMNESIYYSIDAIHTAILNNKKLAFRYFDYSMEKKRVLRKGGAEYIVTPVALLYADDNYYLAAYTKERNTVHNYRVDRMLGVIVTNEVRDKNEVIEAFDPGDYIRMQFSMFGGIRQRVDMMFDKSLVNVVIDRFGSDIIMTKADEDRFIVHLDVELSPAFFAWVFMFGNRVRILGPDEVVEAYANMIRSVAGTYN